jgi:hypothetical protein
LTIFESHIENSDKINWTIAAILLILLLVFLSSSGIELFLFGFSIYFFGGVAYYMYKTISFKKIELTKTALIISFPLVKTEATQVELDCISDLVMRVRMSRGYIFYCLHILWIDNNKKEFNKEFNLGFTNDHQVQLLLDQLRQNGIDIPVLNESYGTELKIK